MIRTEQIVNASRHQIIYGANNQSRKEYLKKLEFTNPILVDRVSPAVICVENFMLPNVPVSQEVDKVLLARICIEHLSFSIAYSIILQLLNYVSSANMKKTERKFVERINRLFINSGHKQITAVSELLSILLESKKWYYNQYVNLLTSGKIEGKPMDLSISFLTIDFFVREVKRLVNISSYFALIFDCQEELPSYVEMSIMDLVSSRINSDISVKLACDPRLWKTYYNFSGQHVDAIHDYGEVKIDSTFDDYLDELKKKRS